MKKPNITKGEWYAKKLPRKIGFAEYEICYSSDGECIADIVYTKEDAELIASAPDLAEALNEMIFMFDRGLHPNSIGASQIEKSKQALIKAGYTE